VEGDARAADRGVLGGIASGPPRQVAEQYERIPGDPELAFDVVIEQPPWTSSGHMASARPPLANGYSGTNLEKR
jgi:hypothetical protein